MIKYLDGVLTRLECMFVDLRHFIENKQQNI